MQYVTCVSRPACHSMPSGQCFTGLIKVNNRDRLRIALAWTLSIQTDRRCTAMFDFLQSLNFRMVVIHCVVFTSKGLNWDSVLLCLECRVSPYKWLWICPLRCTHWSDSKIKYKCEVKKINLGKRDVRFFPSILGTWPIPKRLEISAVFC